MLGILKASLEGKVLIGAEMMMELLEVVIAEVEVLSVVVVAAEVTVPRDALSMEMLQVSVVVLLLEKVTIALVLVTVSVTKSNEDTTGAVVGTTLTGSIVKEEEDEE